MLRKVFVGAAGANLMVATSFAIPTPHGIPLTTRVRLHSSSFRGAE